MPLRAVTVAALRAVRLPPRSSPRRPLFIGTDRRYAAPMCMQCIAGAMTAAAGATGTRAWLIARAPVWLTPKRRAVLTRGLLAAGVIGAGLIGPTPS